MDIDLKELKRLATAATPMVGKACSYFDEHHLREGHVNFENADLFIASERPKEDSEYYAKVHPTVVLKLIAEIERLTNQAIELMDGNVHCGTRPVPREELEDRIVMLRQIIDQERAQYNELESENDRLQQICAAAYQMAGQVGAPVRFLDALSRPCETTQEQIDALLPVGEDEFSEVGRLKAENADMKPYAERMRKWEAIRKAHIGVPCACEFDDDGETLLKECMAHADIIEQKQNRISALETENASLRHDIERSIDTSAKLATELANVMTENLVLVKSRVALPDYEAKFQHETAELVMRHIDRMGDVCEQDTADSIIDSFTKQFDPIFNEYMQAKFPNRGAMMPGKRQTTMP